MEKYYIYITRDRIVIHDDFVKHAYLFHIPQIEYDKTYIVKKYSFFLYKLSGPGKHEVIPGKIRIFNQMSLTKKIKFIKP